MYPYYPDRNGCVYPKGGLLQINGYVPEMLMPT